VCPKSTTLFPRCDTQLEFKFPPWGTRMRKEFIFVWSGACTAYFTKLPIFECSFLGTLLWIMCHVKLGVSVRIKSWECAFGTFRRLEWKKPSWRRSCGGGCRNFSLLPQQLCGNITQPGPAAISWQQIHRAQCIRCRLWAGNLTVAACQTTPLVLPPSHPAAAIVPNM